MCSEHVVKQVMVVSHIRAILRRFSSSTPAAFTGARQLSLAEVSPGHFTLLHVPACHHYVTTVLHEPCCDLFTDASIGACDYAVLLLCHSAAADLHCCDLAGQCAATPSMASGLAHCYACKQFKQICQCCALRC
jgi:hypothetical protein